MQGACSDCPAQNSTLRVGLEDQAQVLSLVTQPNRLCEVAYYVGLKAEAEGRIEDAIAWYRVVLDTGLMQEGEYRWALDALWSWASRARSIASLGESD